MAIRKKIGYRIDPLDLDTRKAIGVKIPFTKKGVFQFNYTTKDQIKSNLINLLLTSPGERYHEPLYGVGIRDILFDQNIETNQRVQNLRSRIDQNIAFHLPQIELTHLKVTPEDKILNIKIEYRILLDNDTNEISITL
jgi:phage baseplate assembly protein W